MLATCIGFGYELVANVVRMQDSDVQFVFLPTQFSAIRSSGSSGTCRRLHCSGELVR